MLIQNISGNSIPMPATSNGSAGTPVASPTPQGGGTTVELPQTAVAQAGNTQAAQPSNSQLQNALDKLNQSMQQANTGLEFSIAEGSQKAVIKVVDTKTGETIKQFPSQEAIAISKEIDQFQKGLLVRQKA
jgi:flagellar protein FlaG